VIAIAIATVAAKFAASLSYRVATRLQSFQPAKHSFDLIALFVGNGIERMESLSCLVVWNDRYGSAIEQEAAKSIAVVGGVRG
jgi:hypothetical protein